MAYLLSDQLNLDLDWYFIDKYRRLCHIASDGGILPGVISENDVNNDNFHKYVLDLPEKFEIEINPNLRDLLGPNDEKLDIETYQTYFCTMAKKGLYSFDKTISDDPYNLNYHLVAKPVYNPRITPYPFSQKELKLISNTDKSFDKRNFTNISMDSFFTF